MPQKNTLPEDLPEAVTVCPGENLEGTRSKLSNIGLRLGVYSPEQAITAEFKDAFRIGPPGAQGGLNVPFEPSVLYLRHVNPKEAKYYPFYEFEHAMAQAKYNEMIEIAQHIRAHVILIDGSSLDEARKARERGVDVFVPVAAAGIGADMLTAGAGGSRSKTNEQARERGYLVCYEAQEPKAGTFLPPGDVIPEGWYFYNVDHDRGGFKGTPFAKLVATAMQGNYSTKSLEINFAIDDHSLAARAACSQAGAKILSGFADRADVDRTPSPVAGVGFEQGRSNFESRRVHYKFKIEMFDQEVYKKLNRLSRTEQVAMNERIRRSSGHVATLRWNNFRIQPMVREDLKFIGATAVPSRDTNLRRGPCCFGDYVRGVLEGEGQNYIKIPITMYGLAGEGKSSVLGTWDSSSRDSPYTFVDMTHLEYRDRVTDESTALGPCKGSTGVTCDLNPCP